MVYLILKFILEVGLMSSTIYAMWSLAGDNTKAKIRGCIYGLIGQPFYMIAAYELYSYTMLIACFCMAICYARGLLMNTDHLRNFLKRFSHEDPHRPA